jgi:hypothetical protein
MSDTWLAGVQAFGSPPAVLVTMVASVILLSLRAWCATTGVVLTRPVALLLDGAIALLFVVFAVLVIIRFETLA